ncbi:hypothetical protein PPL_05138 [Heterostelium album PN500]|uniref:Pentatricopeptide repeat-containing protein n=1 Tax=Heterostelium pallidum (strain ATCC 26659 / Pp 5 / PN500) TaxID=670386 RepID=D3B9J4_HETP5|nr:hypothetical protein PPL_05138 [Heterostelium album PN500]EFA81906.1 hypothetical protein PPL_05138 [Heterostelium album PN500]|eukprot:XP_020434023.1 hypothetical protein PPL_05138 [Heterostelium album PN500]
MISISQHSRRLIYRLLSQQPSCYYNYHYHVSSNNNTTRNYYSTKKLSDLDQMVLLDNERLNQSKRQQQNTNDDDIIINSFQSKGLNLKELIENSRSDSQLLSKSLRQIETSLETEEYEYLFKTLSKNHRIIDLVYLLFRYDIDNHGIRQSLFRMLFTSFNGCCDLLSDDHQNGGAMSGQNLLLESIESIVRLSKIKEFQIDLDIYNSLLEIYVKCGRNDLVIQTLETMKLSLIKPTFDTYIIVASSLNQEQTSQLMQQIKPQSSSSNKPSINSYQLLNDSFDKLLKTIEDKENEK